MQKLTFFTIAFLVFFSVFINTSFADSLNVDKEKYFFGDNLKVTGQVSIVEGKFVGLQILNPSKTDIVLIDQFFPPNDGKFSKSYKAQGPKWYEDGNYYLKIVYNDQVLEKQFFFENPQKASREPALSDSEKELDSSTNVTDNEESMEVVYYDLKLKVKGFPDPSKPPSHYLDRYYNEKSYKEWYDSVFGEYPILDVVGFKSTPIEGFPDNTKPAWHYVDRYNNEEDYRDWFDSQFPSKSIFEVLGYPESLFQKVPDWIKNNAKWWSEGLITDADFLKGIEYLINEKIIFIPDMPESGSSQSNTIPDWIKNVAKWWADGLIDENEFLKGITFLIENKIIVV